MNVVSVKFKRDGKGYYFDAKDFVLNIDDNVLVETEKGVQFGIVKDINIDFEGLNLESIYDRIIKQIIKEEANQKSIENILIDRARIDDLNKKINQLSQKVKSENQFDRKVALNCELNKLKKEMEELNNG